MYYSYKEIKYTGPQGTIKSFNPYYKYEYTENPETDQSAIEALESQKEQCKYLGKAEDLHYYYIPDDYPLVDQDPEIEATPLETLDSTIREKIIISSNSVVQDSDYISAASMMPNKTSALDQQNWAYLYSMIRSLAYKLNAVLEQMPVTLSTEVTSSVLATNVLNTLVNQEVEKQAELVFLTDIEVGRRNKLKQLSLYAAKYEENVNNDMFFTSSIGYKINGDRRSLTNISSLIEYFDVKQQDGTVDFKDYDNQMRKLSKEQLQTIKAELITNSENLYTQKWTLQEQINSADSIDALNAIEIKFDMMDFTPEQATVFSSDEEDIVQTLANLLGNGV